MGRRLVLISIAVLLLGALGVTFSVPKLKAATIRGFTLSASFGAGWNGSKPGPTITVEQGDTVNLVLISADVLTHRFFLSYHNSSTPQSGDPESPDFDSANSPLDYGFTATNTVAAYTYYCYYHSGTMYGTFKVVSTGSIPEFPGVLILPLFMALTLLAVVLSKRKRHGFPTRAIKACLKR